MIDKSVPIKEFRLELGDLTYTGHDLKRPASILAQSDGTLWVPDRRGGLIRIDPDGGQKMFKGLGGEPNGLAMTEDGSIIVANFGTGTIQKRFPDGHIEEILREVDGLQLTCANFVFIDNKDRLWISCSTRDANGWSAAVHPRADGYIVLLDEKGPRIVADGIYFTNEIRLDANEEYLYVAESMRRHIIRFPVRSDGRLGKREVFGPSNLGMASIIDGFAFDADGNIWVTLILRNGIGIITPDGDYHVVLEDPCVELLPILDKKLAQGTLQVRDVMAAAGPTLQFISSVTFGGPDLQTVYSGSLGMDRLPMFRSPVPGLPMRHWR